MSQVQMEQESELHRKLTPCASALPGVLSGPARGQTPDGPRQSSCSFLHSAQASPSVRPRIRAQSQMDRALLGPATGLSGVTAHIPDALAIWL